MDENKLADLLILLDEAEILASEFTGGYSSRFFSAEEFHDALKSSILNLKSGDLTEIETLSIYFAPTGFWDQFVGMDGMDLANKIDYTIKSIQKSSEVE